MEFTAMLHDGIYVKYEYKIIRKKGLWVELCYVEEDTIMVIKWFI